MFDEEQLKDGITLRVYRWDSQVDGKAMMSMMLRMQGEKCAKGEAVLNPLLKRIRDERKAELETLKPKKLMFWQKPDEETQKKVNVANAMVANPLFDHTLQAGEELLNEIKNGLREQGLTMTVESQKSNGEMNELILHWA